VKQQATWLIGIATAVALAGASSDAFAQAAHYDPLRFDSGLAGSYVGASGRGGFGAVFEAKFLAHDRIGVGARVDAAVMFGGNIDAGGDVSMDIGAVGAVLAKGEYYVTDGGVRPIVGLALGMYDIAGESVAAGNMGTASVDQTAGRYFGIAPQLGVDLGRVRLAVTYNLILGADIEVHQMVGTVEQTASFSQNYLSGELSFRWGGRRRPGT